MKIITKTAVCGVVASALFASVGCGGGGNNGGNPNVTGVWRQVRISDTTNTLPCPASIGGAVCGDNDTIEFQNNTFTYRTADGTSSGVYSGSGKNITLSLPGVPGTNVVGTIATNGELTVRGTFNGRTTEDIYVRQ